MAHQHKIGYLVPFRDGRLTWPRWLPIADSLPTNSTIDLAQSREVRQPKTDVLTTAVGTSYCFARITTLFL